MTRKKRRSPWGSITEVRKGKQYTLRYMANTPTGRTRKTETVYGTYKQASLRLAELRVKHANDNPCPTIANAYTWWYLPHLQERREQGSISQSTYNTYLRAWNTHIRDTWKNTPLDSVRPIEVQQWLNTLTRGDARFALRVLKEIERFALRYEAITASKFSLDYIMPKESCTRSKRTFTLEGAQDALRRLSGSMCEGSFIVACFGGARTAESLGVRCAEVYPLTVGGVYFAAVPIVRQMDTSGKLTERLKTASSKRTLLVPHPYGERLLEICNAYQTQGFAWLVHKPDGSPAPKSYHYLRWKEQDFGIPFANLRPSWRTFAQMEWGVDTDTLELLMGHKLPGVTGAHYIRPSVEQLAERFAATYRRI